jgi:FkbM family methyltransferase
MILTRLCSALLRFSKCVDRLGWMVAINTFIVARVLRRPVTLHIKHKGIKFSIRGGKCDLGSFATFYSGFPLITGINVNSILDGGANIGDSSVIMQITYKPSILLAIEPDGENYGLLRKNTASYPNIKCMKAALWDCDTSLILHSKVGSTVSSRVECANGGGDTVTARSITSLARESGLSGFDLVKLDIEGAEREVLSSDEGAWLAKCNVFILELHDHMAPGAGRVLVKAIDKWGPFRMSIAGEYIVFVRESLADSCGFKMSL